MSFLMCDRSTGLSFQPQLLFSSLEEIPALPGQTGVCRIVRWPSACNRQITLGVQMVSFDN